MSRTFSGSVWTIVSIVMTGAAVGCWCAGAGAQALAFGLMLAALAAALVALGLQGAVGRRLGALAGDGPRWRTAHQLLDLVALRLASTDHRAANLHPVTRLPTREELVARIARDLEAENGGHLLGLLHFVEFDQLAAFDQKASQLALVRLAERICAAAQDRHFVGQVDRATFAIWFAGDEVQDQLGAIAYVARQQLDLGDAILTPSIKASWAGFPQDGANAQQLLARATANLTLPAPVRDGRPDAAPAVVFRETFRLEQDLARAIEQEQLAMVFQPVVDCIKGRVIGAEALLRWEHPTLGAVPPARFIPMVERLGLSDRYGLWVLNAACREAARWRAEGLDGLRMAVNLSAQQVLDADLDAKIDRTLLRHGLPPAALELELTETAAMADAERTLRLFTRLRSKGVGLAIDDFGTGYSSLSYLKNLPFTKLKIDREFVTGLDSRQGSRAICKALIELGRGLDLTVLAEGAETKGEVETLLSLGCTVFQGFYFSRPLCGADFIRFARAPVSRVPAFPRRRVPA